MRKRAYHIGCNKELSVVKGRITSLDKLYWDNLSGMMIIATLDDNEPMVEYGITCWPHGAGVDKGHYILTNAWNYIGNEADGNGKIWDFYASNPVQTFTRDEVQEMFDKYFAPFIKEGNEVGDKILNEFYGRVGDTTKQ